MGLVSLQEDIQDAKGEPVKAGKQKGQVLTIEESDELEELDKLIEPDSGTEIPKVDRLQPVCEQLRAVSKLIEQINEMPEFQEYIRLIREKQMLDSLIYHAPYTKSKK